MLAPLFATSIASVNVGTGASRLERFDTRYPLTTRDGVFDNHILRTQWSCQPNRVLSNRSLDPLRVSSLVNDSSQFFVKLSYLFRF